MQDVRAVIYHHNIDKRPIYLWTNSPKVEQAGFKLRSVYVGPVRFYKVEKP